MEPASGKRWTALPWATPRMPGFRSPQVKAAAWDPRVSPTRAVSALPRHVPRACPPVEACSEAVPRPAPHRHRLLSWRRAGQICLLFGPSAAGGAYIPAFCDVVFMVEGNASMYLGSPRMAEMVIGEKTTLEEMGGARMHCEVSGCADLLAKDELSCLAVARDYLAFMPQNAEARVPDIAARQPASDALLDDLLPENQNH